MRNESLSFIWFRIGTERNRQKDKDSFQPSRDRTRLNWSEHQKSGNEDEMSNGLLFGRMKSETEIKSVQKEIQRDEATELKHNFSGSETPRNTLQIALNIHSITSELQRE